MKLVNKYIMLLSALSGVALSSCSDSFLQRDSLVAVSSNTFWANEDDALSGLAACYDGLQYHFLYNDGNQEKWDVGAGCSPLGMDCMTDNGGHFNWSGWMPGYDICNGIHTPASWMVTSYWMGSFEVIKRCNALIGNIDRVPMSENKIEIFKAEAVVLRSLMYTNLTTLYHDVPYFTSMQSVTEAYSKKTDRATIVADVMKDLKDASAVLPSTAEVWGRATKGTALALLGRLALYNGMWDEAINAYREVRKLGYSLYRGDYKDLFTEANEQCSEIIMSVRYEGPGKEEGNTIGWSYGTPLEAMNGTIDLADAFYKTDGTPFTDKSKESIAPLGEDGNLQLEWAYGTRYDNRDPRLKATLFTPYQGWNENWEAYGGAAPSYSSLYVMKYFNPSLGYPASFDSGQDFYIIRYAEVLLSLAEALVEKGGYDYDEVVGLVDAVRDRAHMPKVGEVEGKAGQVSQTVLRDVIRHERRVETAFEGLRLFDLYRWKELKNAVDRINKEAADYGLNYEYRNYRGEMEYVWPIPLNETDANPNLEQHTLWK